MKKLTLITLFLLALGLTGLHAQTLFVKETSGTQTEYLLSDIKMMRFSSGSIMVNKIDGNSDDYDISGQGYLNFTDLSTGIVPIAFKTNEIEILVYPNPIANVLNIDIESFKSKNQTGTFIDLRDGKTYKTIKIGTQTWMAENLAYLPAVSPASTASETAKLYYVYRYHGTDIKAAKATDNYKTYGVLYNWPAAMDGSGSSRANPSGVQGVCPADWHLPSDAEWTQLENFLIANGYNYDGTTTENKIAKSLAATTLWNKSSNTGAIGNNLSVNNSSGFSGLPGGYLLYGGGSIRYVGNYGCWWSSSEIYQNNATASFGRGLSYSGSNMLRDYSFKVYGFSVRCVRDD
jgi:uncharacterized protein (TIGR02145 family)